jgi:hypothetical protein
LIDSASLSEGGGTGLRTGSAMSGLSKSNFESVTKNYV